MHRVGQRRGSGRCEPRHRQGRATRLAGGGGGSAAGPRGRVASRSPISQPGRPASLCPALPAALPSCCVPASLSPPLNSLRTRAHLHHLAGGGVQGCQVVAVDDHQAALAVQRHHSRIVPLVHLGRVDQLRRAGRAGQGGAGRGRAEQGGARSGEARGWAGGQAGGSPAGAAAGRARSRARRCTRAARGASRQGAGAASPARSRPSPPGCSRTAGCRPRWC